MAKKEAFQEKIRQLGSLVGELDAAPGNGSNATAREMVQLLLEVHGEALQRMMEIVFESGAPGEEIIDKAGSDPIVRHLLLLHSLHPDDLNTRVLKALDAVGAKLRKFNSEVEALSINEGIVRVRLHTSGHACGSTGKTIRSILEEGIYDLAPDVTSLDIVDPEGESSSGFVSVESLLKRPLPVKTIATHRAAAVAAD